MIRALFNRPFATRKEIDYIGATREVEILLHRKLRPARATRISGPNSIGMSTDPGKLRARIKWLGYGQWGAIETSRARHCFASGCNPDDEMKRARLTKRRNATRSRHAD